MRTSIVSALCLAALAVARPVYEEENPISNSEAEHLTDLLLKRQGGCKEATLIFCRGTMEPGGPVGMLVGTPFTSAVRASLGISKIEVSGVKYDAGIMGYLIGGDPAGATTMAKMVSDAIKKCPNTKIIMGGYSQGAQVAHLAAAKLTAEEKERVAAVVVFGDPYKGKGIPGISSDKIHTICADSDMICWGLPLPIGAHLSYGSDTKNIAAGAAFIKEKVATHSGGSSSGGSKSGGSKSGSGKTGGGKGKGSDGGSKPKESKPKESKPKESKPKESKPEEPKPEEKSESESEGKSEDNKEMMAGAGHEHGGARLTQVGEVAEDREMPLGAEGNPALAPIVEKLFRQAYADIGVEPAAA